MNREAPAGRREGGKLSGGAGGYQHTPAHQEGEAPAAGGFGGTRGPGATLRDILRAWLHFRGDQLQNREAQGDGCHSRVRGGSPAPEGAGDPLCGPLGHLGVAGWLRQLRRWHSQVWPCGAGHDQHGLGRERKGSALSPAGVEPPRFAPITSLELRRVARHQKLAVATAMQNSRMVKMSSTMEMPFPASSRVGKAPSAEPRLSRADPSPHVRAKGFPLPISPWSQTRQLSLRGHQGFALCPSPCHFHGAQMEPGTSRVPDPTGWAAPALGSPGGPGKSPHGSGTKGGRGSPGG